MIYSEVNKGLLEGRKFSRNDWGDKKFIYYVSKSIVKKENLRNECKKHCEKFLEKDYNTLNISGHIDMFTGEDEIQVGWIPTIQDLISDDWVEVF